MKRICVILAVATCFTACGNNSDNEQSGADSTNSVVLPENRSSDSLAIPGDSLTTPSGVDTSSSQSSRRDTTRR